MLVLLQIGSMNGSVRAKTWGKLSFWKTKEVKQSSKIILEPKEFIGEGDGDERKGFYPTSNAS